MSDSAAMTLPEWNRIYPWSDDQRGADNGKGKALEWLWHFDLDVSCDDIWPSLSDTSRLNRALGLGKMTFTERDGVLHGAAVNGGFRQVWIERPWIWAAGRYLCSVREYSQGFARLVRGMYYLEPLGPNRHRCYVYFGWIPRGVFGATMLRLGMPSMRKGYGQVLAAIARDVERARPQVYERSAPTLAPSAGPRIAATRALLLGDGEADSLRFAPELVDRLIDHVCHGDELDLYRIQVLALARAWGVPEDELLLLCLHATRCGLLDMSWDVLCPHCRGVRVEARSLGEVPKLGECDVCEIDFTTDKSNAIEITFHVHTAIRDVPKVFFCSAEPASKLHIKLQHALAPGAAAECPTRMGPGRYRLRLQGQQTYRFLDISPSGPERVVWVARPAADDAAADAEAANAGAATDQLLVGGPNPTLAIENAGDEAAMFVVETASWSDAALRPARLFNLQQFRDLFAQEYLAADVQLAVGEQTILFTDIVGSTQFYSSRGDPAAFIEVRKHFAEIFEVVGRYHGAVVKTIGDAVMGAFNSPIDGLGAAREIQQRFARAREDTPIRVRISLNTGNCIAVNLNSAIDYFGSTVNIAAKLQACADAGDVSLSQAVMESPGVRAFFAETGDTLRETVLPAKGIGQTVNAHVWSIHGDGDAASSA